jgi:type III pantothenate kinase
MTDLYRTQYPDLTIVITGGDMTYLQDALKNNIFAEKDFTLIGLNSILMHLINDHQLFA